jgi:NADH-quinone oxidoreductase subunit J
MIEAIFLITAGIALICALITVTSHNVVHALLFMVIMMLAIALIFFLLGAPFAAALQIIVYAGAIMVLFIFVTMMLHQGESSLAQERQLFGLSSSWLPVVFAFTLLAEVVFISLSSPLSEPLSTSTDSTKEIGSLLFGPYHQLIILAALMLLSALISAIHISKANTAARSTASVAINYPPESEEQA